MSEDHSPAQVPWLIRSVVPPVVLMVVGALLLNTALGFQAEAGAFPVAVSTLLIVFAVFDAWCRTSLPGAEFMTAFWGAELTHREMPHDPPFKMEVIQIAWIVACGAGMAFVGILPTVAVYTAGYVWFAGRTLRVALFSGLGTLACIYGVFELGLGYELYRGAFFTPGGMAAW